MGMTMLVVDAQGVSIIDRASDRGAAEGRNGLQNSKQCQMKLRSKFLPWSLICFDLWNRKKAKRVELLKID